MTLEQVIIFYLIIAVWWNTNKWIKSHKTIKSLIVQRDKYRKAWTEGNDVIIWEKNEEVRNRK